MTLGLAVFLAGLFGVPLALLALGHRIRRRRPRVRRAFMGAFAGHCVAGVVAVVWGMIPPEAWTPGETGRGFFGLWALLIFPVVGAAVGATSVRARANTAAMIAILGLAAGGVAATQQSSGVLVGVIGNWSMIIDGGAALRADGERWSGTTTRADLEAAMRPFTAQVRDGFVANATSPGAFPLAIWSGTSNFTRGTIRVRFKLVGGKSDQTAGIVFGLQPNGEYNYVRYNTKDGDAALWRFRNGQRERVLHGMKHAQLPLNEWHELSVRVIGTNVFGAVNDSLTVEHTLDRPVSGRVGVWTKRDAVTVFRGYRVTSDW